MQEACLTTIMQISTVPVGAEAVTLPSSLPKR